MNGKKAKALRHKIVNEHGHSICFRLKDIPFLYQVMRISKSTSNPARLKYYLDADGKTHKVDWALTMRRHPDSMRTAYQKDKRKHRHVSPDQTYLRREWIPDCARVLRSVRKQFAGAGA